MILFSDQISAFISAHITQETFDASLMHAMPEVAAQERMVDNGTGQVEVQYVTVESNLDFEEHYTVSTGPKTNDSILSVLFEIEICVLIYKRRPVNIC